MTRKLVAALTFLTALVVVFGMLGALNASRDRLPETSRPLPEFKVSAVTVDSESVIEKKDLLGRLWIANFIFTRCEGPCPVLSAEMAGLQAKLPSEVGLISFTVDPDHDRAGALKAYAARFGADPKRWFFFTGEKGSLFSLIHDGFQLPVSEDPQSPTGYRFTHSARFALIDRSGAVRGYYGAKSRNSMAKLERDALRLLEEPS